MNKQWSDTTQSQFQDYFSHSGAIHASSQFWLICTNVSFSVHSNQDPALCYSVKNMHIARKGSSYSAADLQSTHVSSRSKTHPQRPLCVFPHIKTDDTTQSITTLLLPWKNLEVKGQTLSRLTMTSKFRTDTLLLREDLWSFIIPTAF